MAKKWKKIRELLNWTGSLILLIHEEKLFATASTLLSGLQDYVV
jgi:hypothetical protein